MNYALKLLLALTLVIESIAFTTLPGNQRMAMSLFADYEPQEGEGKINLNVRIYKPSSSIGVPLHRFGVVT